MLFRVLVSLIVFTPLVAAGAQLDVRLVTDEPEAVLAILAKKKSNQQTGTGLKVLAGKLTDAELAQEGFSFFGIQGPWYTVGWRMSALIEETFGKQKLIAVMCDQRLLLTTYNEAAAIYKRKATEPLAVWSESVLALNNQSWTTSFAKRRLPTARQSAS